MKYKLRINLLFQDQTNHEIILDCPPEIVGAIHQKGLKFAQVFIDEYITSYPQVTPRGEIDKYKLGEW